MEHLITVEEFKTIARPVSIHIDEAHVLAYITEAEDVSIIPAIGYDLYKEIVTSEELSEDLRALLEGGEFTPVPRCGCAETGLQYCKGLKATTAYYAYARALRADGAIVSRAGFMQHDNEYARHIDDGKLRNYNDVTDIAERYLSSCLLYIQSKINKCQQPAHGSRARIYAIGD